MESLFPTQRARRQTNEARQEGRTTTEAGTSNRRGQNAVRVRARRVDKSRRRRDEFSVSLKCFKLGIIDWNPDSKENANKDLTMANFKDFINHEEVNLSRAVKVDNGVGTLQGLQKSNSNANARPISSHLISRSHLNLIQF